MFLTSSVPSVAFCSSPLSMSPAPSATPVLLPLQLCCSHFPSSAGGSETPHLLLSMATSLPFQAQFLPTSSEMDCLTLWPHPSGGGGFLSLSPKAGQSAPLLWSHLQTGLPHSLTLSCKLQRTSALCRAHGRCLLCRGNG